MEAFLNKTADYIYDHYRSRLGELCIVLPSRRAGLFLKKHLAAKLKKPSWAPVIYSIEDFVSAYAGYQPAEKLTLLFELYEIHREIEKNAAQSFDDFFGWGEILLNDFNDIDLYLGDAAKIFNYLNDTKALELWDPGREKLTDFEKAYLRFFNSLEDYYKRFRSKLQDANLAYGGMAYRYLAENLHLKNPQKDWHKIIFAGFNALSRSEEAIISALIRQGNDAEILWNADKYYMNNPRQEAGNFLRTYKQDKRWLHENNWIENDFSEHKNIEIIGVPQSIGQAKVCGDIINKLDRSDYTAGQTAIVLANENLLLPVLNSLPESIEAFNVTMGLSLKQTLFFDLCDAILGLYENRKRYNELHKEDRKQDIYYRDLLKVLEHPYIIRMLNALNADQLKVIEGIKKNTRVFYSFQELKTSQWSSQVLMPEFLEDILQNWNSSPQEITALFTMLIGTLRTTLFTGKTKEGNSVEMEQLFSFARLIKRFESLLQHYKPSLTTRTFRNLFKQLTQTTTIPFYGEPLKGIQVMGVLETRALSFKNLIMLSVNDDQIPAKQQANSFIPYEIKKKFNLPTFHDRDSIYAYHFYRLIQQSENIYLTYNTEPGQLGGGDRSRFITQILYELPKYNANIHIRESLLNIPLKNNPAREIKLPKTQGLWEDILERTQKGLSPTAISTYITCPLQFYFENIAAITEMEEVEETIDQATLGSVVHDVLYELYHPLKNKKLSLEELDNKEKEIRSHVSKAFGKHYDSASTGFGKNRLIYEVAVSFIENFLKSEKETLKNGSNIQIVDLEKKVKTNLHINDPNNDNNILQVALKGTIDRVDRKDETLRIVDYKTGNVNRSKELKVKDWQELTTNPDLTKAIQVLIYGYLWYRNTNTGESMTSGVISLRKFSEGFQAVTLPDEQDLTKGEIINKTEGILKDVFTDLLNKNNPIVQTPKPENCTYCPFKSICNR
ncbi:MAG: PD-(D/E)XK nuclease family protein [Bacteroidales bacterium]|nr:PD-(D/E)XK nuclease family protein [Bacteroidales bacterium]